MPSNYAHYRFGSLALPELPEERRRSLQRFRQLYDVGLHGPDLFFYFLPLFHTKTRELGGSYHKLTGKEFFETAAARLREQPSEGGEAYLFGVLGHYALDSACHPLVNAADAEGKIRHVELETEFDRHLLALDGAETPETRDISGHMRLTWGEAVTVSGFYPPASAYAIRLSVKSMALINRGLSLRNRKFVETAFRLAHNSDLVMYSRPNRKCAPLIPRLQTLFDEALARYPAMAEALEGCLRDGTPLGEYFDAVFG